MPTETPAQIKAEATLSWDEELQCYFVIGLHLPADFDIRNLSPTMGDRIWVYQNGKLINSIDKGKK